MERLVQLGLDPQRLSRQSLSAAPQLEIDAALVQRVSSKMAAAAKGDRALRLPPACVRSPPWLTSGTAQQCGGPVDADADVEESLRGGAFNDLTAMYHLLHEQHSIKAAPEPPTDTAAAPLTSEDVSDAPARRRRPLTVSVTETVPVGGPSPTSPVRHERRPETALCALLVRSRWHDGGARCGAGATLRTGQRPIWWRRPTERDSVAPTARGVDGRRCGAARAHACMSAGSHSRRFVVCVGAAVSARHRPQPSRDESARCCQRPHQSRTAPQQSRTAPQRSCSTQACGRPRLKGARVSSTPRAESRSLAGSRPY